MSRVRKMVAAAVLGGSLLLVGVPASADPIDCPPGQEATKNPSEGGWICVNKGGNENNSEDPKNPNVGKGFFRKG